MKKIITLLVCVALVVGTGIGFYFIGYNVSKNNLTNQQIKRYDNNYNGLDERTKLTAHNGCLGTKQDSLESLQKGAEICEIVELDLNFDSEGNPVLSHNIPKGDNITLDEALNALSCTNVSVQLDIKDVNQNFDEVYNLVAKYSMLGRVFYGGIDESNLEDFKKSNAKLPFVIGIDYAEEDSTNPEVIKDVVEKLKKSGAIGLNVNYKKGSAPLTKAVQDAGFYVSYWTVDNILDMYAVISYKPDNITTNHPDVIRGL